MKSETYLRLITLAGLAVFWIALAAVWLWCVTDVWNNVMPLFKLPKLTWDQVGDLLVLVYCSGTVWNYAPRPRSRMLIEHVEEISE